MGAITGTVAKITEFGGTEKLAVVTATIASASDTIALATTFSAITGILGIVITGGQDAAFTAVSASFSGTTITVTSVEQDGTAATNFTGTTVSIGVIGVTSGV
jgi:hypothetical protein